jgi:hypothetical protein
MTLRRALAALAVLWFAAAGLYYLWTSVDAVLRYAPHSLYADQWRQYLAYIQLPFPENIWYPDNGHRSVLPNLVAWLEIRWLDGNQWLQIAIGLLSGFGAAAIAAWICVRDRSVTTLRCAAAAFLCFFAVFWLANVRTLFHSTELLHTKLPMLCLMLALALCIRATRERRTLPALVGALLLGLAATFSFGYGLSVFVGIAATLAARKADRRQFAVCAGGLLLAAGLYLGAPGSAGVTASMSFAPIENLLLGARWLGAPFVTMFPYLWNPDSLGLVPPGPARNFTGVIAHAAASHGVDLSSSVMPQALFGAFGMLGLIVASLRCLRAREAAAPMEALGFGIAWFGLGAAGIISLSRLAYFQQHPDQIYADRYLCWPCLFWLGLALIGLARACRAGAREVAKPQRSIVAAAVIAFALALPVLAQPTQYGGGIYAALVRGHVDNTAAASIVGVIERDKDLGETIFDEFVRGTPVFAQRRIAQFADPAATSIGQILPADQTTADGITIETQPVADNAFGEAGTAIVLRTAQPAGANRFLLIDADRRVVGLVVRDARLQPSGYSGYVRGIYVPNDLRAAAIP